ncbi:sensor histidine kinase [Actinacidiphila glaucinigra]|uniref:sensor histidine kinase n=1 Tax=Actinacidiphila glaucinigra TaxID=235986 RepID=UPI0037BA57E0
MRRALAGVALAVTSMVALSFLIPLALLVQSEARTRATTVAEQRAAALAPVLALTTRPADVQQAVAGLDSGDHLSVRLPDGQLVGTVHASQEALDRAADGRRTMASDTSAGWVYLQPVILARDRVAVVEAFVPRADLDRGVKASWAMMALLALGLVAGSVLVADRLGARVVRASRGLSRASRSLGAGELGIRVEPAGPPELQEAGTAFNTMADRVVELLAMERELVADLSHRLRTPLTRLQLEAERIAAEVPGHRGEDLEAAIAHLESELDSIIDAARTPLSASPEGPGRPQACDASAVVRGRVEFWSVLAAQQGRECRLEAAAEATAVPLGEDDLAAVVDALIGNVFRHTPQGTALAVTVERSGRAVLLTMDDAGPGIGDPDTARARGVSVGGSTGLGLDIVQRAASAAGGGMEITGSPLGGARVRVTLGLAGGPPVGGRKAARRARRHPHPA